MYKGSHERSTNVIAVSLQSSCFRLIVVSTSEIVVVIGFALATSVALTSIGVLVESAYRTERAPAPPSVRLSDHPSALMSLLYIGVILFIWYYWPTQLPAHDYVAASALAYNHRIISRDLRWPPSFASWLGFYMDTRASIEGKYVNIKQSIPPGQPVTRMMVADKPDMKLPDNMVAIAFGLSSDSRLIGLLDVRSAVLLVGKDPDSKAPVSIRAVVQAIICDPNGNDQKNCYPILEVSADQSCLVSKNLQALQLVLTSDCSTAVTNRGCSNDFTDLAKGGVRTNGSRTR